MDDSARSSKISHLTRRLISVLTEVDRADGSEGITIDPELSIEALLFALAVVIEPLLASAGEDGAFAERERLGDLLADRVFGSRIAINRLSDNGHACGKD